MARKKTLYNKKLGQRVAAKAQPLKSNHYHVVLSEKDKWSVITEGNIKALRVFQSQDAVNLRNKPLVKNCLVIIHKRSGLIQGATSYSIEV